MSDTIHYIVYLGETHFGVCRSTGSGDARPLADYPQMADYGYITAVPRGDFKTAMYRLIGQHLPDTTVVTIEKAMGLGEHLGGQPMGWWEEITSEDSWDELRLVDLMGKLI